MRLLLDANLSPRLVESLVAAGHDVVHVDEVGLLSAADREILAWCDETGRVVVTADTDFPMLMVRQSSRISTEAPSSPSPQPVFG